MKEIHYCVECKNYVKPIFRERYEHPENIPAKCKAILSVVSKEPCECELARDGYSKCDKYEPANPKEGS